VTDVYGGVRALVLGAAGFIGRWVARALTDAGAEVVGVVRDAAAGRTVLDAWGARAEIVQEDLSAVDEVPRLIRGVLPAVVFNLAGYGVDPAERDEALARALNRDLVRRLCQAVSRETLPAWRGARLVHVGTALEYGARTDDLREDLPSQPLTLYGETKAAGTAAVTSAHAAGLRATTARLFTIYGPGEHDGRLLPSLLAAAGTHDDIPLTTGGQQRDFTYVEDVADGLLRLGTQVHDLPPVVNLATGRLASVRQFVETAAEVLAIAPSRLRFGAHESHKVEMTHRPVNVERLRALTAWTPPTDIRAGVGRTAGFRSSPKPPGPRSPSA